VNGKPVFALVPFPRDLLLPAGTPDELFTVGVPIMGPKYNRREALEVVVHPTGSAVVCFGAQPLGDDIGVELATGHVVWMFSRRLQSGMPHLAAIPPGFVNSDVGSFIGCVRAAIARFPYYSRKAELEERVAVADGLAGVLRRTDAAAIVPDRFWSTFVDDLTNGDFATEDVLGG
jgi:hypothetical protein